MYDAKTFMAIKEAGLEKKAEQISLSLYSWATGDGMVVASERAIAGWTGLPRSTVWHRVHRLEEMGWLRVTRVRGMPTIFELQFSALTRGAS